MQDDDTPPASFPLRSHGRLNVQVSAKPRDLMADVQVKGAFTVKIVTLFPEAFPGTLGLSLTGKALDLGLWRLIPIALRPFGEGKHRNVDDTPAGGGAGMVLRADVLDRALDEAAVGANPDRLKWPVIYLSPRDHSLLAPGLVETATVIPTSLQKSLKRQLYFRLTMPSAPLWLR